jgi:drug/metabolite transporter (DMT)-like permease
MLALSLGLTAALIWAVHDLLARKLSQGAALLPIVAMVLLTGCLVLLPLAWTMGDWAKMTPQAWIGTVACGFAFAVAIGCLYKAFSLAPVRLVSPVIGAYPLLTLVVAVVQGRTITLTDWIAVTLVVIGIGIVAFTSRDDGPELYAAPPAVAIGWAALAALGFAATFALGQVSARLGSELPVILTSRIVALAAIAALALWSRNSLRPPRGQLVILSVMGVLDAAALGLVTASGNLPKAEYASVTSSLFGVLTILLAARFLKESVRPVQWTGIAAVFAGIAVLGMQGG